MRKGVIVGEKILPFIKERLKSLIEFEMQQQEKTKEHIEEVIHQLRNQLRNKRWNYLNNEIESLKDERSKINERWGDLKKQWRGIEEMDKEYEKSINQLLKFRDEWKQH